MLQRWIVVAAMLPLAVAGAAVNAQEPACPKQAPASARPAWPPRPKPGELDIVHFGEAHWNEGQGPVTMPVLVQDVVSYRPQFVLFSSDIADIGTIDRLACFADIMRPIEQRGIEWFDSPGNHDRGVVAGPGGVLGGEITDWRAVFGGKTAPWGDEAATDSRYLVPKDEPDDGAGASTHYYFDFAVAGRPAIRAITLDNSLHSLTNSDTDQYPAVGPGEKDVSQLAFLERVSADANEKGLLTFVVMHQPTRDPRNPENVYPTSYNHTMMKGATADNLLFELIAQRNGVDGVLLGHIKGHAKYEAFGVPYFIDGGGGGSPYARTEVGTDHGYFYGFRVLRASRGDDGWGYRSYLVPLAESIELTGPRSGAVGDELSFEAAAIQPHDPDLPGSSGLPNEPIRVELRPPAGIDPLGATPPVSYMWTTSNPGVLKPVAADTDPGDDPAFDARRMTTSGIFSAVGAGRARITIMTGTHLRSVVVTVK